MVWKKVLNSDGGDSDHFGGNDIDKISDLFSGVGAVDLVDINSDWTFRDNRLRLRNPANTFSYILRTSAVNADREITLPLITGNDSIVTGAATQTLTGKTLSAYTNTFAGLTKLPSARKTGMIQCGGNLGGNSGQGLLFGFVDMPALPIRDTSATQGFHWEYATGTTVNTVAGIRLEQLFTRKEFNPRFKAKWRPDASTGTSSTRVYVGLSSDTTPPIGDSPLTNNDSGVVVGWRSTDTNIQVFRNSGTNSSSSTPTVVNTGLAKQSSAFTSEIEFTGNGTSLTVRIGNPDTTPDSILFSQTYTTNLPAADQSMGAHVTLQNSAAVNREFDIFYVEMEQDK